MKNRPNFEDAPHGSAILNKHSTKFSECPALDRNFLQHFSGCSAQERDFLQNFQDALQGSAILNDEVDEGSTKAVLAGYQGIPLKTAMLNEEEDLERSTPVVKQYSFHRLHRSIFERRSRRKLCTLATGVLLSRPHF